MTKDLTETEDKDLTDMNAWLRERIAAPKAHLQLWPQRDDDATDDDSTDGAA